MKQQFLAKQCFPQQHFIGTFTLLVKLLPFLISTCPPQSILNRAEVFQENPDLFRPPRDCCSSVSYNLIETASDYSQTQAVASRIFIFLLDRYSPLR